MPDTLVGYRGRDLPEDIGKNITVVIPENMRGAIVARMQAEQIQREIERANKAEVIRNGGRQIETRRFLRNRFLLGVTTLAPLGYSAWEIISHASEAGGQNMIIDGRPLTTGLIFFLISLIPGYFTFRRRTL